MTASIGSLCVGGVSIGSSEPCFVIAEAGVNHNGDIALAKELVSAAKYAGADAVKFQTFRAERLVAIGAPKANYQLRTTDTAESQIDMLKRLELSQDAYPELAELCRKNGLIFLSTPYCYEDVELLDSIGVVAFKLASIHCAEPRFVEYVAAKKRPIFLATGMADLVEVDTAVAAARGTGNRDLVLLQCTTEYPSRSVDANLRVLQTFRDRYRLPVGYSDHTESMTACVVAVALGASVIEKHLTLNREMRGPDHAASFDPQQLRALISTIREAESTLGLGEKRPCAIEIENMKAMRRSLAARRDLAAGEFLADEMVSFMRPGTGLKPSQLSRFIGRQLSRAVKTGSLLMAEDFESEV